MDVSSGSRPSLLRTAVILLSISAAIFVILAVVSDAPGRRFGQLAIGVTMLLNAGTLWRESQKKRHH